MTKKEATGVSPTRLRIGVSFLMLWLLPFWWFGPGIADILGFDTAKGASVVTFVIVAIQTALGLIGAVVAGKQLTQIVRGTPIRKMPRKVSRILWTGTVDV
jgi:hypothetical protein